MRRALLQGAVIAVAGLACGIPAHLLGAPVWLDLLCGVLGAALAASFFLQRRAEALARSLAAERSRHQATRDYVQRILDVVPMPIYVKDAESRYLIVNRAQAELWGRSVGELVGVSSVEQAGDPALAASIRSEDLSVLAGERIYKEEQKPRADAGGDEHRVVTKGRCLDPVGDHVIVCALFDTTHWRRTERQLQETLERETLLRKRTEAFVQRLIDVNPEPFYIKTGEGRFIMVNEALARERGVPREALIGTLSHVVGYSSALAQGTQEEDLEVIRGVEIEKEQHYLHPLTGEERFRSVIKRRCVYIDGEPVIIGTHVNITRWKIAERELARIANEDMLTGLPNRRRFADEAERMMSRAARRGEALSLLLFDLDHFKLINDSLGHVAGDGVLQQLSRCMRQYLRAEDLPCRWGGEEFAVLLPESRAQDALRVAERLRLGIASVSFGAEGAGLCVTISCGIAEWRAGERLEQLLARADAALYQAKEGGRNACLLADGFT